MSKRTDGAKPARGKVVSTELAAVVTPHKVVKGGRGSMAARVATGIAGSSGAAGRALNAAGKVAGNG